VLRLGCGTGTSATPPLPKAYRIEIIDPLDFYRGLLSHMKSDTAHDRLVSEEQHRAPGELIGEAIERKPMI
jgi:hypothetical protein